jgi:LPXTG-motif cell wall-anchored protein
MLRRILLAAAAVVTAGAVSMAPAGAGGNYGGCNATVSDTTPSAGQVVTVTGSGAADGGAVSASFGDVEIGTGTADAQGNFSFEATIPSDASGEGGITVSCGAGRGEFPITVEVAGTTGSLPRTGSESTTPMVAIGLGAVAAGAVLVGAARKRARTT